MILKESVRVRVRMRPARRMQRASGCLHIARLWKAFCGEAPLPTILLSNFSWLYWYLFRWRLKAIISKASAVPLVRMTLAVMPWTFVVFSVAFEGNRFQDSAVPCFRMSSAVLPGALSLWTLKATFLKNCAVPCFCVNSAVQPGILFNGLRRQPLPQTPQFHASA